MIGLRNKVKGMFVGGAIGDALGAPVETWKPDKIKEVHGGPVRRYVAPIGHKWFKPEEFTPGMTTDDTQLVVAVAEGMMAGHAKAGSEKNFDHYLDGIAQQHVIALKATVGGWGKSTVEAVRRIANGVHWSESGKTTEKHRGTGNGAPMKIAPLAAWACGRHGTYFTKDKDAEFRPSQRIVEISAMTHYTKVSANAAVVHANTLLDLIETQPGEFTQDDLFAVWRLAAQHCNAPGQYGYTTDHLEDSGHDIWARLDLVKNYVVCLTEDRTVDMALELFGGGSCCVNDSLPFSYAMFLRGDSDDFEAIIETANAGGDNDTNAKFVGEMMGALHGIELFQRPENVWACEGLKDYRQLLTLADHFCDLFEIP